MSMKASWHNLREYEALRALIQYGTTTAAGRKLGISQSAASRMIGQLESRLGRTLFLREGGRLQPTEEATRLNAELEPLFDTLALIDRREAASGPSAILRVTMPPTLGHRFLQRRIAGFMRAQPGLRIQFDVASGDQVIAGVAEERADIGITDAVVHHAGVKTVPFRASRLVCVMPAGHPLTGHGVVTPECMAGYPFVAIGKRHSLRTSIDRLMARHGVSLPIVVETTTAVSALEFVRSGLGIGLLNPFPIAQFFDGSVIARPFEPAMPFRTAFLTAVGRPASGVVRAFMRHIRMSIPDDSWSEAC